MKTIQYGVGIALLAATAAKAETSKESIQKILIEAGVNQVLKSVQNYLFQSQAQSVDVAFKRYYHLTRQEALAGGYGTFAGWTDTTHEINILPQLVGAPIVEKRIRKVSGGAWTESLDILWTSASGDASTGANFTLDGGAQYDIPTEVRNYSCTSFAWIGNPSTYVAVSTTKIQAHATFRITHQFVAPINTVLVNSQKSKYYGVELFGHISGTPLASSCSSPSITAAQRYEVTSFLVQLGSYYDLVISSPNFHVESPLTIYGDKMVDWSFK